MSEKSPKNIKNTCKTNIYKFRANSKKAQQVNPSPFKSAQVPWTYFFFDLVTQAMEQFLREARAMSMSLDGALSQVSEQMRNREPKSPADLLRFQRQLRESVINSTETVIRQGNVCVCVCVCVWCVCVGCVCVRACVGCVCVCVCVRAYLSYNQRITFTTEWIISLQLE